ncbi:MAG TPA: type I-U CRISPR-associated protein Cas7 [Clostridiales bacterium]|nr:type I-U CRISPR-associated protein Cas7 [Clostridiales bacterium]
MVIESLQDSPRLLFEARLKPVQGERLQPTGFPDLGAATYTLPDGTDMLLVESPQSMANRLEAVCWDPATDDLVPDLKGLPYVRVKLPQFGDTAATCSVLEFHRLNSPYILNSTGDFTESLRLAAGLSAKKPARKGQEGDADSGSGAVDLRKIAAACFRHDPNSVLHGVFLEKLDGRARLPRLLSAFIEARGVRIAQSGGVKFDRVDPSGDAKQGYGNVPFSRTEFVADSTTAYFNLDLATMRGYGLGPAAEELLLRLALWKVDRFLKTGLRLRTACDLDYLGIDVTRPAGLQASTLLEATDGLANAIARCAREGLFADPPVTEVVWAGKPKTDPKKADRTADADAAEEENGQ